MISFICSSKYSSSILRPKRRTSGKFLFFSYSSTPGVRGHLSASSRIRISMWLSSKLGVLWRWSISLPGVAIKTSGPALKATS